MELAYDLVFGIYGIPHASIVALVSRFVHELAEFQHAHVNLGVELRVVVC